MPNYYLLDRITGHDPAIRAGDADRERTAERLRESHAEGRLDLDEFQQRLERLVPAVDGVSPTAYLRKLAAHGGVVEERITGRDLRSPSVQLEITPAGAVTLLSTHDQILAVGDASLQTAGAVALANKLFMGTVISDLIVNFRTHGSGSRDASADLYGLYRLN